MPETLLAIDIGTSTVRTLLARPNGDVLAVCLTRNETRYPQNGQVEQDANLIWNKVERLIHDVLDKAALKPADIASIGITSQRAGVVIWDVKSNTAVAPMIVWSDLRGVERAKAIMEAGFISAAQLSSAKLESAVTIAEQATGKTVFANPSTELRWGNIDSFIVSKLTSGASHITDASQLWPMGYLDLETLAVNEKLLDFQNLPDKFFPDLVNTWGHLAMTSVSAIGAEIPIGAILADQQSAMFPHSCLKPGESKITFGTAGCIGVSTGHELKLISESVLPFIQYKVDQHCGFCLEGMMNTAGTTLDWLAEDLGLIDSVNQIAPLAQQVTSSEGVWVLPSLLGLGAPHADNEQRMVIGGLNRGTKKAHVIRATLEGIAYRIREMYEYIYELAELPLPDSIGVDGGAAASDELLQIQADVLGIPVKRHKVLEATALGASLCAGIGIGSINTDDLTNICQYSEHFEPGISTRESGGHFEWWKSRVYPR